MDVLLSYVTSGVILPVLYRDAREVCDTTVPIGDIWRILRTITR